MNSQNPADSFEPEDDAQANTRLAGGATGRSVVGSSASGTEFNSSQQPYITGHGGLGAGDGKLQAGDRIGDYEILSLLGVGGMGFVYKARHSILEKVYALKTLNYEKVNETAWRRLQLEAQAIARMNHPNVISIHNLGLHDGALPFYVMDLLEGDNLADIIAKKGALSVEEALPIFIGVAAGLGYAHKKGIIHRDIKPGNIFLLHEKDSSGATCKLVDFGIAKLSGVDPENQNLTSAGEIFGSPYYMSPEHCDGKRIDARSDIYSVGCTFFEILTGLPPFRGANSIQTMMMHQSQKPPGLSQATGGKHFPPALEDMVATMLEKAPMDRYQNLEEVVTELKRIERYLAFSKALPKTQAVTKPLNLFALALKITCAIVILLATAGTFYYWYEHSKNAQAETASAGQQLQPLAHSGNSGDIASNNSSADIPIPNNVATSGSVASTSGSDLATDNPSTDEMYAIRSTKPYFLGIVEKDGKSFRHFDFGSKIDLGQLDVADWEQKVHALGEQFVPAQGDITLNASPDVISAPYLLDGFAPADLCGITFSGPGSVTNSGLHHVGRLTGLRHLTISESSINQNCMADLNQLSDLKELALFNTALYGSELATLKRLPRLAALAYVPAREPRALLNALKKSQRLDDLTLEYVPLTAADFEIIGSFSGLRRLRVNGTELNNDSLKHLAKLTNLKELEAKPSQIDRRSLAQFKKFRNLKELSLGGPHWFAEDPMEFSSGLPGVFVH